MRKKKTEAPTEAAPVEPESKAKAEEGGKKSPMGKKVVELSVISVGRAFDRLQVTFLRIL